LYNRKKKKKLIFIQNEKEIDLKLSKTK